MSPGHGDGIVHLACAADAAYLPWCATMLHSALSSGGVRLMVHFLHPPDLPQAKLDRLGRFVEQGGGMFRPSCVERSTIETLPGTRFFPKIIWYRSFLPSLRPELDRILYLDSDTLVVGDLQPLWETNLDDAYVAAVRNLIEPALSTRHHALGIPPEQIYFNSGVLLMNLAAMRRDHCLDGVLAHAARYHGRSIWPDQDSLNYVLGPKSVMLHPRWNCQNSFFYWPQAEQAFGKLALEEALTAPAILHFEGPPETKPWHWLNQHPYRARYWQHLRQTPFARRIPEGITLKNTLRRYLPARNYQQLQRIYRLWRSG